METNKHEKPEEQFLPGTERAAEDFAARHDDIGDENAMPTGSIDTSEEIEDAHEELGTT